MKRKLALAFLGLTLLSALTASAAEPVFIIANQITKTPSNINDSIYTLTSAQIVLGAGLPVCRTQEDHCWIESKLLLNYMTAVQIEKRNQSPSRNLLQIYANPDSRFDQLIDVRLDVESNTVLSSFVGHITTSISSQDRDLPNLRKLNGAGSSPFERGIN